MLFGAGVRSLSGVSIDPALYLALYDDVASAVDRSVFDTAMAHFIEYGSAEGRVSAATATSIPAVQGAGHVSPFAAHGVLVSGVVTAVDSNGFYLQDVSGDGNDATSDGIFVSTSSTPSVSVTDLVDVTGVVSESIPGGTASNNLSITQIGTVIRADVTGSADALPTRPCRRWSMPSWQPAVRPTASCPRWWTSSVRPAVCPAAISATHSCGIRTG